MDDTVWWSVARSEEVDGKKPISVALGDLPIALWRDHQGIVRALEDRCPHRRAPLSLGCVRTEGWLQCGYHGWSFDGASGRLMEIPNMKDKQRFPPTYRANVIAVAESGGLIQLCLNKDAAAPSVRQETLPLGGTVVLPMSHEHFLDALFDDPALLLQIKGVLFTTYLASDLAIAGNRLVQERQCQWRSPHWPAAFSGEFPITLRIAADAVTGESELLLRDDALRPLLNVVIAPVPAQRGTTQIRWRAGAGTTRPGWMAKRLGWGRPFKMHEAVDGKALRVLKPSASLRSEPLRNELLAHRRASQSEAA